MANEVQGTDVIISVDGSIIGAQRNARYRLEVDSIDMNHKMTGGHDTQLPGRDRETVECDGLIVLGDTAQDALETAARDKSLVTVVLTIDSPAEDSDRYSTSKTLTGSAWISNLELGGGDQEASTWSCTLNITGGMTAGT